MTTNKNILLIIANGPSCLKNKIGHKIDQFKDDIKAQTREGLKRYFANKRDLGMRDRKDITFGLAFKKWVKAL